MKQKLLECRQFKACAVNEVSDRMAKEEKYRMSVAASSPTSLASGLE
jgi:hypothetical protein